MKLYQFPQFQREKNLECHFTAAAVAGYSLVLRLSELNILHLSDSFGKINIHLTFCT